MNFSTSALPLFLLPASVVIFGWIREFCCYKHSVSRMTLTIYMYRCMVHLTQVTPRENLAFKVGALLDVFHSRVNTCCPCS